MIQASHATTVAVEASRAAHEAYLLAKEAAAAPAPPTPAQQAIPAKPKPKQPPSKKPPKPTAKTPPKPKPTAKTPDVPEGWTLLDPPTAKAVRRLMQSHPQTRSF